MIPRFQPDGNLPPGIHIATWDEVERHFGGNPHREYLLAGLRRAIDNLAGAGCRRVYINGSFVTGKPLPVDFDACWETAGVDFSKVLPTLYDSSEKQKAEFGGELYPVGGRFGHHILAFFQRDRQGRAKGIIAINLGEDGND